MENNILYDIYYEAGEIKLFKENVTQEMLDKFLNSLTPQQESSLRVKRKTVQREEIENER